MFEKVVVDDVEGSVEVIEISVVVEELVEKIDVERELNVELRKVVNDVEYDGKEVEIETVVVFICSDEDVINLVESSDGPILLDADVKMLELVVVMGVFSKFCACRAAIRLKIKCDCCWCCC